MSKNEFKLPDSNKDQFDNIKLQYKGKDLSKNKDDLASITNKLLTETKKNTLDNMGVSDKTLNDLTRVLNDSNNCDSECKKARQLNDSRDTLLLAIQILNGAPSYFDVSRKNFLIEKYGKSGFVDHTIDDAKNVLNEFIKDQEKINNNLQTLLKNMINNYSYNVQFLESIDNTLKNSKNNLSDVDNKINEYTNLVNLDERTNYFLSNDIRNLRNFNFYITIIYYIALILILFFKNFFSNFKVSSKLNEIFSKTNIVLTIILIILLFLPFILRKVIILSINYYENFLQFMNIQRFTKSYGDIITSSR